MATTVRSILNRAAALLNDEEHVRWEESELLEWLNDGQRVVAKGPATDAYVLRDNITAVAGTVQSLPTDAIRLVDVVKNDTGLSACTNAGDINEGAAAANEMNKILIEAIESQGLASDNLISVEDIIAINQYIRDNHYDRWVELHGDDHVWTDRPGIENEGSLPGRHEIACIQIHDESNGADGAMDVLWNPAAKAPEAVVDEARSLQGRDDAKGPLPSSPTLTERVDGFYGQG